MQFHWDILGQFVNPPKIDSSTMLDLQKIADNLLAAATQRWEEMWTDHAIEVHLFLRISSDLYKSGLKE